MTSIIPPTTAPSTVFADFTAATQQYDLALKHLEPAAGKDWLGSARAAGDATFGAMQLLQEHARSNSFSGMAAHASIQAAKQGERYLDDVDMALTGSAPGNPAPLVGGLVDAAVQSITAARDALWAERIG